MYKSNSILSFNSALKYSILFISVLCFGFSGNAIAQTNWSLQRCITYAKENSIAIKQNLNNVELARLNLEQSKGNRYPTLNGSGGYSVNFGRNIDPTTNEFTTTSIQAGNTSLSSGWNIYSGLQVKNSILQSETELRAAQFDYDAAADDIDLQVLNLYMSIVLAKAQVKIAEKQVENTLQQQNRTQGLIDAGMLPSGDMLDIEAQLANDNLVKTNAINQVELSKSSLKNLLNLDYAAFFDITDSEFLMPSETALAALNPEQVYANAINNTPQFKSDYLKLKSAKIGVDIAKGALQPSVSLFGNLNTRFSNAAMEIDRIVFEGDKEIGFLSTDFTPVLAPDFSATFKNSTFLDQIQDNFGRSVGLNVSVPIFNGFQRKINVSKAKLALENVKVSSELRKNQLRNTLQQAYINVMAAKNQYNAALKTIEASKKAYEFSKEKYDLGLSSTLDVNTAQNNLFRAEASLNQSKYDLIYKAKVLDHYQGIKNY